MAKVGEDGAIGFWSADNIVHWKFAIPQKGTYEFYIMQSAIESYKGTEYKAVCNKQELKGKVEATAHWGDFAEMSLGTFTFDKPGTYIVSIVPTKVVKWVMNCAGVRLKKTK
jgi:hypothetical protein